MLRDLIDFEPEPELLGEFTPLNKAAPEALLEAQVATSDWLTEMGVPPDEEIVQRTEQAAAREAFTALNYSADTDEKRVALSTIKTPAAVQHLVGMLTAYDWDFINQAKELRGFAVTKILEETKHPDARIRLKALQMLGNVTEVALFTTRVEVTKRDSSEEEIEARLRERLSKFITPKEGASVTDVTDVEEVVAITSPEDFSAG